MSEEVFGGGKHVAQEKSGGGQLHRLIGVHLLHIEVLMEGFPAKPIEVSDKSDDIYLGPHLQ